MFNGRAAARLGGLRGAGLARCESAAAGAGADGNGKGAVAGGGLAGGKDHSRAIETRARRRKQARGCVARLAGNPAR